MTSIYDPQKHHRRSIRLPGYDYTRPGRYYITIVTHNRECLFGEIQDGEINLNQFGQIAKREWERLPTRFKHIELGIYVIMPNHIHGIICISEGTGTADSTEPADLQDPCRAPAAEQFGKPVRGSLPTMIRSFKSAVSLRIGYARPQDISPLWQRNYYEHIVRDDDDYRRIQAYILNNPRRWKRKR